MSHWAFGLAQLWQQLVHYNLELVTLSSYDWWIPFERDANQREILRMGQPIRRMRPGTAPPAGQLCPMQLAVAMVIPRPPTEPLYQKYPNLPLGTSSRSQSRELEKTIEEKVKKLGRATGRDVVSGRHKKRGRGEDDGDERVEVAGYGALPGVKLLAAALKVTVAKTRSIHARHFVMQEFLDGSDLAGCILPNLATTPASDTEHRSSPPPRFPMANLTLVSYLSSGRLWDAYTAVLTGDGLKTTELIAKVTCLYTYDEGNPSTEELFEDSQEAVYAYHREAALYRGPLAKLQGGVVPLVYGSFEGAMCLGLGIHGGFDIFVELTENVGEPADGGKGLRDLPIEDKLEIEDLYRQLHAVRVLHWDVEPRHIRRRADGRFALIDFDSSTEVERGDEGDRQLASEARRVRQMLGLRHRSVPPKAAAMTNNQVQSVGSQTGLNAYIRRVDLGRVTAIM